MMEKIWHCKLCESDFLAPRYQKRIDLHPELDGVWREVAYEALCPECGSGFVEEVWACEACGSHPKVMGSDFCSVCHGRIDKVINPVIPKLADLCEDDKGIAIEMLWDYYDRHIGKG